MPGVSLLPPLSGRANFAFQTGHLTVARRGPSKSPVSAHMLNRMIAGFDEPSRT